ncbi:unnamed protein product [Rotaria sp. Silwood1]|nr:unnamed protein product [Rotaria sp. Silwood1]CAF1223561.1 unnamed protein product [Rotaria sp. Silwood1]CAF1315945.1 unnamed protein product [Rotaria sp. Silwood1]CAF3461962.1 unnamed protein product [Rotaria sp. Silwood1]
MSYFALDHWPIELIYTIFEFLSDCDIVLSFFNTSSRMNDILQNYKNYTFKFTSISRKNFHFILDNINLSNIVSLTLSDDRHTGGQFGLFLSYYSSSFHLFTRLSLLNLHDIKIKKDQYDQMKMSLRQFKQLRYLHLDHVDIRDIDDHLLSAIEQLDNRCLLKIDDYDDIDFSHLSKSIQYYHARMRVSIA